MEQSSRPACAEAGDVFNTVLDGTDAVMLSGEPAVGRYPVEAVAAMSRIAAEAESYLFGTASATASGSSPCPAPGPILAPAELSRARGRAGWVSPITEGVVEAASLACRRVGAALVVVATHAGRTALVLSKQRHATPTWRWPTIPGPPAPWPCSGGSRRSIRTRLATSSAPWTWRSSGRAPGRSWGPATG